MKILKFHRKPKLMAYTYQQHKDQGEEKVNLESPEAPLIDVDHSFNGIDPQQLAKGQQQPPCLKDVVLSVMELPLHYGNTMIVRGFDLSHTKAGTRSMKVYFTKSFKCGKVEAYTTPLFQFDNPAEGEDEKAAVSGDEVTACDRAAMEAERYITGERQQMTLDGVTHGTVSEPEDPNQDKMDLDASEAVVPSGGAKSVKTPKKKAAKKAAKKATSKTVSDPEAD